MTKSEFKKQLYRRKDHFIYLLIDKCEDNKDADATQWRDGFGNVDLFNDFQHIALDLADEVLYQIVGEILGDADPLEFDEDIQQFRFEAIDATFADSRYKAILKGREES